MPHARFPRLLAIAALGVAAAVGVAAAEAPVPPSADTQRVLAARSPLTVGDLRLLQSQLERVVASATPASAAVEIGRAAGSAVVVSKEGLVLTAGHVVGRRPGRAAWVTLPDGRRLRGHTLGADHDLDAGMIQLDNPPENLPFAPMHEGQSLQPGEWVVTIGQPGGLTEGRRPPVRFGRVLFVDDDVICTDCTLVGGDSGGPLFNMSGEVVGIHSSIGPSIAHNFHVPIRAFKEDWEKLLAGQVWGGEEDWDEDRPIIGVRGREQGGQCLITQVFEDLPGDKAGVLAGDIVTAVDGKPITTFDELAASIVKKKAGDVIQLSLRRNNENIDAEVRIISAGSLRRGPRGDD